MHSEGLYWRIPSDEAADREMVPETLLEGIAGELRRRSVRYYTCHCTGQQATRILRGLVPDMHSLSCGETIELP